MTGTPFFSVILNTHNANNTIRKTISSVLGQTFRNFELIIVDDCSTDDTLNIVHEYLDHCDIHYIIIPLQENHGISYSRNIGIDKATGKYIAFIDDDDLWIENKLEKQFAFLEKHDFLIDWVFSNYFVIDKNYQKIGNRHRKSGFYDWHSIIRDGNPVGMLTVVVKRQIIKENKFRNLNHEDYDLWIRLSKKGIAGYLMEDELAEYMRHKSKSSNKLRAISWTYRVFRINGISSIHAFYLILRYVVNYFSRETI